MDVRDILDTHARLRPDKVAIIHGTRHFTYRDLADTAEALAQGLAARLNPGDPLAIWLPNGPELICLYFACFRCGIVPMPMHSGMKWPEVSGMLEQAQARVLVADGALLASVPPELRGSRLDAAYAVGMDEKMPGVQPWTSLMQAGTGDRISRSASSTPGIVLHTSGSEGRSKGVMLSFDALNDILAFRLAHTRLSTESISVVASCLTQSVGLHQCLALLAAGGSMVLLEDYDIDRMAQAVLRYRPTHLIMVVNAFERLLHHPGMTSASLASLVFASVGADRVTRKVQDRFIALTGIPLNVSYGMTESSWAIVNFDGRIDKCLALGKPAPGVALRLVDRRGRDVARGEVGEIWIRSPRTMLGYWRDDLLTRGAFVEGWLASGDLAYQDDEDYYWFAGRCKQVIVLSTGDTVSPIEVEQVLLTCPGVARCMVLPGELAEDGSQVPVALVERSDSEISEAALHAYLAERLSAYKLPRRIDFVSELPVGPTGKLWRGVGGALSPRPAG